MEYLQKCSQDKYGRSPKKRDKPAQCIYGATNIAKGAFVPQIAWDECYWTNAVQDKAWNCLLERPLRTE